MATYEQIQKRVKGKHGWAPETCWIAHCKELKGLPVRRAHNGVGAREKPCPADKRPAIFEAFSHFGMI